MQPVIVKPYLSPTLVLLAFNWEDAPAHQDFLGFAIKRTPGFRSADGKTVASSSWLPNRIGFDGAVPSGSKDWGSNVAPIQKFMWWDNRIDTPDEGRAFTYEIWPTVGPAHALQLLDQAKATLTITLPSRMNANGIGSWFNRAVVRSQAFERICQQLGIKQGTKPSAEQDLQLRTWLANSMEKVVPAFLDQAACGVGAIYHLTDTMFILPAFVRNADKPLQMVYDAGSSSRTGIKAAANTGKHTDNPNQTAIDLLGPDIMHTARTHTSIMHNKFIVSGGKDGAALGSTFGAPSRVVMGSANYTTEGLSEQANLMHVIESEELASLYLERGNFLLGDPSIAMTKHENRGWSASIGVGAASIRASFSPEPNDQYLQIQAIVDAISKATNSVLFCLFDPTDKGLRDACFAAGDKGLMMFGLVNKISVPKSDVSGADPAAVPRDKLAALEVYHRNQSNRDVIDARYFDSKNVPAGFAPEFNLYPGSAMPKYPPVIIHHKFIVIDGETDHPIVYTGSANMSNNSEHNNDENLLEISGDPALAAVYLAEFMRLYEHYRARANVISDKAGDIAPHQLKLAAAFDQWGKKYFVAGDPAQKARLSMVR